MPMSCTPETAAKGEPAFVTLTKNLVDFGTKVGLDTQAAAKFCTMLKEAGFVQIHVRWEKFPFGPWAKGKKNKEIGYW
jgi:hypothetical protein